MPVFPLLFALVTAVAADQGGAWPPVDGVVVDAQGKPLGQVEVLFSYGEDLDGSVPVAARARSDEAGRFRIEPPQSPAAARMAWPFAMIVAYVPGKAIGSASWSQAASPARPLRLLLRESANRAVVLKRANGSAVIGARVAPVRLSRPSPLSAFLPDELVERLAAETGPDGRAELRGLAAGDTLDALRVAGQAMGSRVIGLDQKERTHEPIIVTIPKTGRLAGSITSENRQAAPRAVELEIWARTARLPWAVRVHLDGPPIRTAADGSFQTPETLWQGQTYRIVARPRGLAPVLSPWVKLEDRSAKVAPLMLAALKSISGRVVDRQRRPVAGAEVLQAGDGPDYTSSLTDPQGRFVLGGYRLDKAFVFAEKPGFRFGGRCVDTDAAGHDVEIVLTQVDEQPDRPMPTLPDPLAREEMRALALRVIEPYLERALQEGSDGDKTAALRSFVPCEPATALERAVRAKLRNRAVLDLLRGRAGLVLGERDYDEAAAVASTIEEPGARARYLVALSDALPAAEGARKRALLTQAVLAAKAASQAGDKAFQMADVAERLLELKEIETARTLLAEAMAITSALDKRSLYRPLVAARLARVDLPAAEAMIDEIADPDLHERALGDVACRVAADRPADAERLVKKMNASARRELAVARVVRAMAPRHLDQAKRLPELCDDPVSRACAWLFLGAVIAKTGKPSALDAFRKADAELDQLLHQRAAYLVNPAAALLPLVELIEPALVGEVAWRSLALRDRGFDPRQAELDRPRVRLALLLARYDRELAGRVIEPALPALRTAIGTADNLSHLYVMAVAAVDPRQAVSLVETMPRPPGTFVNEPANLARARLAEFLGETSATRWQAVWRQWTNTGSSMYDRDLR